MDWKDLIAAAEESRARAYCPYSGYRVGAALLDENGAIHRGCNVENASFGATVCAERSAIAAMITAGGRVISKIAIATSDGGSPCGICLQTILEFRDSAQDTVILLTFGNTFKKYGLAELLPHAFDSFTL